MLEVLLLLCVMGVVVAARSNLGMAKLFGVRWNFYYAASVDPFLMQFFQDGVLVRFNAAVNAERAMNA